MPQLGEILEKRRGSVDRSSDRMRRGSKRPEDEEDQMEKDLGDDAVWKKIQLNTFAR